MIQAIPSRVSLRRCWLTNSCWLRALAAAGKLDGLLTAIAIDGKWLHGVADGQVKLFAAMLHEDKVMIAQHRIPDDTNEITQVKQLLTEVDLTGA
ncbi:MAG: hypothetical protein JO037_09435, partial [Actinobacteria bacterium]|nr:hypothetical protein [Actinomycetota bacterium]